MILVEHIRRGRDKPKLAWPIVGEKDLTSLDLLVDKSMNQMNGKKGFCSEPQE